MPAQVTAGGSGVNGTVTAAGRDDAPQVQLIATDTESTVGLGARQRPGRVSVYDAGQAPAVEPISGPPRVAPRGRRSSAGPAGPDEVQAGGGG